MDEKLKREFEEAQAKLGERYLLHESNRVKRLKIPHADRQGANVAATFARVRRELREAEKAAQEEVRQKVRKLK